MVYECEQVGLLQVPLTDDENHDARANAVQLLSQVGVVTSSALRQCHQALNSPSPTYMSNCAAICVTWLSYIYSIRIVLHVAFVMLTQHSRTSTQCKLSRGCKH